MLSAAMPNYSIADNMGEVGILVALPAKYFSNLAHK